MRSKLSLILVFFLAVFSTSYAQNYDETTANSNETIIFSIETGNIRDFRKAVKQLDNLNDTLSNGFTILNYAIYRQRLKFVRYLIKQDVDIEKDMRGLTPLMFAAYYDLDILKLLLSRGADVNRCINGNTAFLVALKIGNKEAADILGDNGADYSLTGGPDGPHIFDYNSDTSIVVSVTMSNQLKIDTFNNNYHEVCIRAPVNDSFKFSLREPETELQSVFEKPDKIFAISDIEGNYLDFVTILKNNGIVDSKLNWSFGEGHLVLLGDFIDRGAYATQVLWLIYKLEREAIDNGGKVHYIIGNHEVMNILGNTRYVHNKHHILAYLIGKDAPDFFSNNTFLGRWMATKNVIEKIGDYLFVHGGISDSIVKAKLSIPRINHIARNTLKFPQVNWDKEAKLVMESHGVIWYRGLITGHLDYEKMTSASLDEILNFYDAKHMVIGHCIVEDITTDYDGKVIRIDVNHYINASSGIYIEGDQVYKATKTGERELIGTQNMENLF